MMDFDVPADDPEALDLTFFEALVIADNLSRCANKYSLVGPMCMWYAINFFRILFLRVHNKNLEEGADFIGPAEGANRDDIGKVMGVRVVNRDGSLVFTRTDRQTVIDNIVRSYEAKPELAVEIREAVSMDLTLYENAEYSASNDRAFLTPDDGLQATSRNQGMLAQIILEAARVSLSGYKDRINNMYDRICDVSKLHLLFTLADPLSCRQIIVLTVNRDVPTVNRNVPTMNKDVPTVNKDVLTVNKDVPIVNGIVLTDFKKN